MKGECFTLAACKCLTLHDGFSYNATMNLLLYPVNTLHLQFLLQHRLYTQSAARKEWGRGERECDGPTVLTRIVVVSLHTRVQ